MTLPAGSPAPEFRLVDEDGEPFTHEDLRGEQAAVLVFYPNAFSPVCTDQFTLYDELRDEFAAQGARLFGVSCDQHWSQRAFREQLGVQIPQLSDFEPKGETSRAFGAYFEPAGFSTRALVIVNGDGTIRWSWEGEHPGVLPGANLIFDGLAGS